jgi:hypothetical protein
MQKKRNPATTPPSKRRETSNAAGPGQAKLRPLDAFSENIRRKCGRESLVLVNDPHEAEVLNRISQVADVSGGWS